MGLKVRFLGGVRTVTGSMHLLTNRGFNLLIDCGLFQGRRAESFERNSRFPFDPPSIDALVLSHAHIDHSGNIPNLVKRGFRGRIVTTEATRDLCAEMLPDSGHIQEEDVRIINIIHARKGLPPVMPLYTQRDAEEALPYFRGHPYHAPIEIADDLAVTFYDAGHILGSAVPALDVRNGARRTRIAYVVDLGRARMPILRDPETPPGVDYMFLESTYGGRYHASIEEAKDRLAATVNDTVGRGGKIIVPSFALERTQELAYYLTQLLLEGRIPEIPIFVDSPLAVNITEIFGRHPECFDEEWNRFHLETGDPFGTKRIKYITSLEDSMRLKGDRRPMIIISASGMCEAGRILHHLANNVGNRRNTILIVGYAAQNTLGRRIVEREKVVKILGEERRLRAEVVVLNSFSAHADRNDLLAYATPLKGTVKGIFVVHGDEDQSEKLAAELVARGLPARVPNPGEEIDLA